MGAVGGIRGARGADWDQDGDPYEPRHSVEEQPNVRTVMRNSHLYEGSVPRAGDIRTRSSRAHTSHGFILFWVHT